MVTSVWWVWGVTSVTVCHTTGSHLDTVWHTADICSTAPYTAAHLKWDIVHYITMWDDQFYWHLVVLFAAELQLEDCRLTGYSLHSRLKWTIMWCNRWIDSLNNLIFFNWAPLGCIVITIKKQQNLKYKSSFQVWLLGFRLESIRDLNLNTIREWCCNIAIEYTTCPVYCHKLFFQLQIFINININNMMIEG